MSFAVRKIEEPMTPLISKSTESTSPSPRTRVGFEPEVFGSGAASVAGKTGIGSIIQYRVRRAIPAACRSVGRSQQNNLRRSVGRLLLQHNSGSRADLDWAQEPGSAGAFP